jgi:hypothetical protein
MMFRQEKARFLPTDLPVVGQIARVPLIVFWPRLPLSTCCESEIRVRVKARFCSHINVIWPVQIATQK